MPLFDSADDEEIDPPYECTTPVAKLRDTGEGVSIDDVANETGDGSIQPVVTTDIANDENRWRTEVVRDALSSPLDRLLSEVRSLVATLCTRLEEAMADTSSQQIIDEIYEVVLSFSAKSDQHKPQQGDRESRDNVAQVAIDFVDNQNFIAENRDFW